MNGTTAQRLVLLRIQPVVTLCRVVTVTNNVRFRMSESHQLGKIVLQLLLRICFDSRAEAVLLNEH